MLIVQILMSSYQARAVGMDRKNVLAVCFPQPIPVPVPSRPKSYFVGMVARGHVRSLSPVARFPTRQGEMKKTDEYLRLILFKSGRIADSCHIDLPTSKTLNAHFLQLL